MFFFLDLDILFLHFLLLFIILWLVEIILWLVEIILWLVEVILWFIVALKSAFILFRTSVKNRLDSRKCISIDCFQISDDLFQSKIDGHKLITLVNLAFQLLLLFNSVIIVNYMLEIMEYFTHIFDFMNS